jgi:hypothetical protein
MTRIAALALIFAVTGKAHAQEETFVARGAGAEDPMFSFSELQQAIVRSGQKCERVRGVLTIHAIHTVTCQNGTARIAYYDLTARTGVTTVLRVERRRNY